MSKGQSTYKKRYMLTAYPHLYCNTWWGRSGTSKAYGNAVPRSIIEARNAMATGFHIQYDVAPTRYPAFSAFSEFYRTAEGYLMVYSVHEGCSAVPRVGESLVPVFDLSYKSYFLEATTWTGMHNLIINATGFDIGSRCRAYKCMIADCRYRNKQGACTAY